MFMDRCLCQSENTSDILLCAENVCSAIFTRTGSFEPSMTLVWVACDCESDRKQVSNEKTFLALHYKYMGH